MKSAIDLPRNLMPNELAPDSDALGYAKRECFVPSTLLSGVPHQKARTTARWLLCLCLGLCGLLLQGPGGVAHADKQSGAKNVQSAKALLAQFASLQSFSASFVEKKYLRVLAMPIQTSGSVQYTAPDVLVRTTKRPSTRLTIDSKSLRYKDAQSEKDLPLDEKHPARAFVQVFLDLVRGDRLAIEKSFDVEFVGDDSTWELQLLPRKGKVAGAIKTIKLRGNGLVVSWMEIIDRHGDRTETLFSDVKLKHSAGAR
ncbi:MAG: outer membrane lipoprotein carrier protein LolA [Myxococcales bacterium]|nr:outer membrane lipoprotein carrier protein LolA [Myxococcales bacterium]